MRPNNRIDQSNYREANDSKKASTDRGEKRAFENHYFELKKTPFNSQEKSINIKHEYHIIK